ERRLVAAKSGLVTAEPGLVPAESGFVAETGLSDHLGRLGGCTGEGAGVLALRGLERGEVGIDGGLGRGIPVLGPVLIPVLRGVRGGAFGRGITRRCWRLGRGSTCAL